MTYADYVALFDREIDRLGGNPCLLGYREILQELSRRGLNPEVDDAIRVFAVTREWPAMTESERFAACLRLEQGKWYCAPHGTDEVPSDETQIEFLESLLIDYWLDVGRGNWMYERFVQAE